MAGGGMLVVLDNVVDSDQVQQSFPAPIPASRS